MDLLHSRPYSGTREGSDVMKWHQASSFQLKIPAETIYISVPESKIQLLPSFLFTICGFDQKSERKRNF